MMVNEVAEEEEAEEVIVVNVGKGTTMIDGFIHTVEGNIAASEEEAENMVKTCKFISFKNNSMVYVC